MATGDLIKLGTLYIGDVKVKRPTNPIFGGYGGNIPNNQYGELMEIRNTDSDDAYKMQWREVNDGGKKYLVCDRVYVSVISVVTLNALSLISGKTITIDGNSYGLRLLTGGASDGSSHKNNEWDKWIVNEANIPGLPKPSSSDLTNNADSQHSVHNKFWNWWSIFSWTQEKEQYNSGRSSRRGNTSAKFWSSEANNIRGNETGWRPVLEVLNTAPTIKAPIPTQSVMKNASATLNLANYFTDAENDALSYTATSSNANTATATVSGNTLTLTGKEIGAVTVTVTASDGQLTATQSFTLNVTNTAPSVSVSSPSTNVTLYENDILNLEGAASDVDTNQSITVYAQVNNEQRIALAVGLSNATVIFTKQLKFVGGKLFDGETAITGNLADGITHTLKIWSSDGNGGQSAITERVFYVVPNRPPILTVDAVQPSGIINTDKFTVSGNASDPDGNAVTAAYKINGGNSIALEIVEGKWDFEIALAQLKVGQNTIVVELTDSYNFKVSKTIKLNKNEVRIPVLYSVARYKIELPVNGTNGIVSWVENGIGDLNVKMSSSMVISGEQEKFLEMDLTNNTTLSGGIEENEFSIQTEEKKNDVSIKVTLNRTESNSQTAVKTITGALQA